MGFVQARLQVQTMAAILKRELARAEASAPEGDPRPAAAELAYLHNFLFDPEERV